MPNINELPDEAYCDDDAFKAFVKQFERPGFRNILWECSVPQCTWIEYYPLDTVRRRIVELGQHHAEFCGPLRRHRVAVALTPRGAIEPVYHILAVNQRPACWVRNQQTSIVKTDLWEHASRAPVARRCKHAVCKQHWDRIEPVRAAS